MCRIRRSTKHRRTKKNGELIMANISRRNFMKVAAGAAGIAGLGLLNGCSKTEAPASSAAASAAGSAAEGTTTPAAAAPATDKLYTASINPQLDESEFRSNTKELTTLFSPLTIGSMEISNRMVKSAAGSATYLAGLTDELLTYYVNLAMTMEEGIAAAKLFEQAGCDSMHLRLGPLGHHVAQFGADLYFILNGIEGCTGFGTQYDFSKNWQGMLIGNTSGCGIGLNVAAEYKKALSIPCGVVTYNDPAHAPDFFEQALEDGKADFFLMTRPLTVDMEYVNKLKEGRIDEIAPCTRCLHCHIGSNEANAQMAYCRVNALTQRVMREGGPATYELEPAATPKKVMVIGGGPAGMEAARIAAARGHNVTLYEKRGALGFMLDFAASVKGPHENLADLKNYLIRQLELNGVEVKTGTEVTQELINSEAPDAVILAAGGLRDTLTVDGDGSAPVVEMDNFMFTEMGDNVIVYGSNAQAFDAALWLTVHKKNVTIVTPNPASEFDMQQSQHAMRMMTTALYALGVKSYPQSAIKTVSGNVATLTLDSGVEMNIKCDAIVNGADMLPNTSLVDGIGCKEVYTIGDCANPFNIALAIRGGNDAGRAV